MDDRPRKRIRSAALLVGSTPSWVTNVQYKRGPDFQASFAKPRWGSCLGRLPFGFVDERAQVGLEGRDLVGEPGAVLVFAVAVPGLEEAAGELEAVLAEELLGGQSFRAERKSRWRRLQHAWRLSGLMWL